MALRRPDAGWIAPLGATVREAIVAVPPGRHKDNAKRSPPGCRLKESQPPVVVDANLDGSPRRPRPSDVAPAAPPATSTASSRARSWPFTASLPFAEGPRRYLDQRGRAVAIIVFDHSCSYTPLIAST